LPQPISPTCLPVAGLAAPVTPSGSNATAPEAQQRHERGCPRSPCFHRHSSSKLAFALTQELRRR
jgi:hypothetical protein